MIPMHRQMSKSDPRFALRAGAAAVFLMIFMIGVIARIAYTGGNWYTTNSIPLKVDLQQRFPKIKVLVAHPPFNNGDGFYVNGSVEFTRHGVYCNLPVVRTGDGDLIDATKAQGVCAQFK